MEGRGKQRKSHSWGEKADSDVWQWERRRGAARRGRDCCGTRTESKESAVMIIILPKVSHLLSYCYIFRKKNGNIFKHVFISSFVKYHYKKTKRSPAALPCAFYVFLFVFSNTISVYMSLCGLVYNCQSYFIKYLKYFFNPMKSLWSFCIIRVTTRKKTQTCRNNCAAIQQNIYSERFISQH